MISDGGTSFFQMARRPLGATIICLIIFFVCPFTLMRALHILPSLSTSSIRGTDAHLHRFLGVLEPLLEIAGGVGLWQMRRWAYLFFFANALVVSVAGLYSGFIALDPSARIQSRVTLGYVYAMILFVEWGLTYYVWKTSGKRPVRH